MAIFVGPPNCPASCVWNRHAWLAANLSGRRGGEGGVIVCVAPPELEDRAVTDPGTPGFRGIIQVTIRQVAPAIVLMPLWDGGRAGC